MKVREMYIHVFSRQEIEEKERENIRVLRELNKEDLD